MLLIHWLLMAIRFSQLLAWLWPTEAPVQHRELRPFQTEKFQLTAGPSSAEGYPMTIQFGAFVRSDGKNLVVPSGHYLNSKGPWNMSGIVWGVGEETQPAPERLDILYFSHSVPPLPKYRNEADSL